MNSGTIAGLTSAPLKTKGWNFIKGVITTSKSISTTNTIATTGAINGGSMNSSSGNFLNVTGSNVFLLTSGGYNDAADGLHLGGGNSVRWGAYGGGYPTGAINGHPNGGLVIKQTRTGSSPNLQLGKDDANPPISQYFSVQNASGANISGVPRYIDGCQGTGTGSGGSIVFRTADAGVSSSTLNTLVESVTISPTVTTITNQTRIQKLYIPATDNSLTPTLNATDAGNIISYTNSSPITLSLPAVGTVSVGYQVVIIQDGAGLITIANNGNTVKCLSTTTPYTFKGQYGKIQLICVASNTYHLSGDIV